MRRSLRRFSAIFRAHHALLVRGARKQRGHPCQKQPSTKMASRTAGTTTSGRPGRSAVRDVYRMPCARRRARTRRSGPVPRVLTRRMRSDTRGSGAVSCAMSGHVVVAHDVDTAGIRHRVIVQLVAAPIEGA